jgi:hypothetical protein
VPYVVPKVQSLQYTGQNDDAVRQIVGDYDYWTENQSYTGSGVQWNGADGNRLTLTPGDYLIYDFNQVKRMSQSDYEARYREIV